MNVFLVPFLGGTEIFGAGSFFGVYFLRYGIYLSCWGDKHFFWVAFLVYFLVYFFGVL